MLHLDAITEKMIEQVAHGWYEKPFRYYDYPFGCGDMDWYTKLDDDELRCIVEKYTNKYRKEMDKLFEVHYESTIMICWNLRLMAKTKRYLRKVAEIAKLTDEATLEEDDHHKAIEGASEGASTDG